MKDEIKEKQLKEVLYGLDYIGNKIKNDDGKLELGVNNCKILLDYITNLQEENKRLKELCDKYEEEHNTTFKLWKGKLKETMDETLIQKQQNRIKELETINEEHRRINGELRKTINEAIEYLKYQIPQLDFEKDMKAKMLGAMVLVLLQGKSDE